MGRNVLGDGLGKIDDHFRVNVRDYLHRSLAINSGTLKIDSWGILSTNNDLQFVIPSIATDLHLTPWVFWIAKVFNLIRTMQHVGCHLVNQLILAGLACCLEFLSMHAEFWQCLLRLPWQIHNIHTIMLICRVS
jgi:hypothetical protein